MNKCEKCNYEHTEDVCPICNHHVSYTDTISDANKRLASKTQDSLDQIRKLIATSEDESAKSEVNQLDNQSDQDGKGRKYDIAQDSAIFQSNTSSKNENGEYELSSYGQPHVKDKKIENLLRRLHKLTDKESTAKTKKALKVPTLKKQVADVEQNPQMETYERKHNEIKDLSERNQEGYFESFERENNRVKEDKKYNDNNWDPDSIRHLYREENLEQMLSNQSVEAAKEVDEEILRILRNNDNISENDDKAKYSEFSKAPIKQYIEHNQHLDATYANEGFRPKKPSVYQTLIKRVSAATIIVINILMLKIASIEMKGDRFVDDIICHFYGSTPWGNQSKPMMANNPVVLQKFYAKTNKSGQIVSVIINGTIINKSDKNIVSPDLYATIYSYGNKKNKFHISNANKNIDPGGFYKVRFPIFMQRTEAEAISKIVITTE